MSDDEASGTGTGANSVKEEEETLGRGRSRRKNAKYFSGDFKDPGSDFEDEEEEEEEEEVEEESYHRGGRGGGGGGGRGRGGGRASTGRGGGGAGASKPKNKAKFCPSCEEPVRPSETVCQYCDYVFTSAARAQDETPVTDRFPYEPEREDDGSLKVELILGRRKLQTGVASAAVQHEKAHAHGPSSPKGSSSAVEGGGGGGGNKKHPLHHHRPILALKDPRRERYCYEYLVKFKNAAYMKSKWLTFHQVRLHPPTHLPSLLLLPFLPSHLTHPPTHPPSHPNRLTPWAPAASRP